MYAFARGAGRPVTRDEAAAAVGISRKLAAFHLDKLVDAGLLRCRTAPTGGTHKVGRRPKVYEPSGADIHISIPVRRLDALADILLHAVLATGEPGHEAAIRVATERGAVLGEAARAATRAGRLGPERALTIAETVLTAYGFEPTRPTPTCLRLRNCPFQPLTGHAPGFVCALNQAFLTGVLASLHSPTVQARRTVEEGGCCVELSAPGGSARRS
ncbi:MAG TPA: transcriptional regulator [Amycolatopsis sp.]|uniref:helix-turn-helix transcriptional regulator n=1 Tax=Amycolatopsis sp. TaxID=37632 RepID=UPI002B486D73|nr:transcriptional regulator [Amycolatopsis sp.]HKS48214.1 transcriptional regulator [Amycolatopsis sp.]